MNDSELLEQYRECHLLGQALGLAITIEGNLIVVNKNGDKIFAKMGIAAIYNFLIGYQMGASHD